MKTLLPPTIALLVALGFLAGGIYRHVVGVSAPVDRYAGLPDDERAFRQVCSSCHALPDPRTETKEGWPGVVAEMHERAVSRDLEWTEADMELAVQYLQQHGR